MRIGRLGFVAGLASLAAAGLLVAPIAALRPFHMHPDLARQILFLALALASWTLVVLRCHDFNRTVWLTFWTDQVPIIGPLIATYELLAKPGSVGMNNYGGPPRF
jgi:uncharacterized membrane protein YhaH (DUF805 family)